jgi:hypothetical protein
VIGLVSVGGVGGWPVFVQVDGIGVVRRGGAADFGQVDDNGGPCPASIERRAP